MKKIKKYTKAKTPHFFRYAKGKELHQVEKKNDSIVNKLDDMIKGKNLRFNIKEFGKFDYKYLMHNPEIVIDKACLDTYIKIKS